MSATKLPTAQSNIAAPGGVVSWSLAGGGILTDDATYASVALSAGQQSHYLSGDNFGFAVPASATVTGIEVEIERYADDSGSPGTTFADVYVRIFKAGNFYGLDHADTGTSWPASPTIAYYGGASDDWYTGFTYADYNAATFEIRLAINAAGGMGTADAYVDFIRVTLHYSDADGEQYTAVSVVPVKAWADLLAMPGDVFVGWNPHDGEPPADTSPSEMGYVQADMPGEWHEDAAGDWYATLPQGVEVVVSSTVDQALAYFAPLPDWPERPGESFALLVDMDVAANDPCGCAGALLLASQGNGTIRLVSSSDDPDAATSFATIALVAQGSGTIKRTLECEC